MRVVALVSVLAALALGVAQPAAASTVETDCANLATTLAAATTGETIVLSGMCAGTEGSFGLPEVAALTIEGAPSGVNGFDGTGAFGAALFSGSEGTDGLTLRNLTFKNYEGFQGAVWIKSTKSATHQFAFIGDRFLNNVDTNSNGGGLSMIVEEPKPSVCGFTGAGAPVTLTESVFTGNTDHSQAGGGAYLDLECAAGTISASVTNNVFTANKVAAGTEPLQGGGLWVGLGHEIIAVPFTLSQQGNLLEGNAVENTSTEARRVEGGGEFTDGGPVTSLDDRFIANSISGAKGSSFSSEGGGFASLDPGECSTTPGVSSTATNLIATGNSIGAPSGSGTGGEGGGIYVGCLPGKGGYHLTLLNSTITANSASGSGASAGLDGETNDTAVLENSIVTGNLGAPELGGFGAVDGEHLTASFSDVCALESSTSPFAGTGNICAAPALANAISGDVRETATSPTIDAGSNALAGSLATDAFGAPRITAGRAGDAAVVDIGASESAAVATPPRTRGTDPLSLSLAVRNRDGIALEGCDGRDLRDALLRGRERADLLGIGDAADDRDGSGQTRAPAGERLDQGSQADRDRRLSDLQRPQGGRLGDARSQAQRNGPQAAAALPPPSGTCPRHGEDVRPGRDHRDGAPHDPRRAPEAQALAAAVATPPRRPSRAVCAPAWRAARPA
ncbi:MAG TPA: hypothetical protein VN618_09700 [Solirubrobacteraceae bacterium]|nr:hypothetical protein [Solirubrobacteraceae bacterium]